MFTRDMDRLVISSDAPLVQVWNRAQPSNREGPKWSRLVFRLKK